MSIALAARLKELQQQVAQLKECAATFDPALQERLTKLEERLTALENRPKPGRPPKNG